MSVITRSALESSAEAFVGFCGTERQKRELRRRQLLEQHRVRQPESDAATRGEDDTDTEAVSPAASSQLPSHPPPAAAALCVFKDEDAVQLERCISSIDISTEQEMRRVAQEILTVCSNIVRVPAENVVEREWAWLGECACRKRAALDSGMCPAQQLWFSKIANERVVGVLLRIAQFSKKDATRALVCSALEHIAFFESGRFVMTSDTITPILLHMANHVREEKAVISLLRIFPAFCCGTRTQACFEAFVKLGCAALGVGCPRVIELYFVAFEQLSLPSDFEAESIDDDNRQRVFAACSDFLMRPSLVALLTRADQIDGMTSSALGSLCNAFLNFTNDSKGIELLSNDAGRSAILRLLMKIDDPRICLNMTCNLARMLRYFPASHYAHVLQVMCRCSAVAPFYASQSLSNGFNINILTILEEIAGHSFDSVDGSQLSIFRPFATTLLRMAACTDGWGSLQDDVFDRHHILKCKMTVLRTASNIFCIVRERLLSRHSSAASGESACAQMLQLECSADEIGSTNPEFRSIESLLLSCLTKENTLQDYHLEDDKFGVTLFFLLKLRSNLYFNDNANLELNNRLIFTTLSRLQFSKCRNLDLILETAFSCRNFDNYFARQVTSVNCENFQTISRLCTILSSRDCNAQSITATNPWRKAMQYTVFKSLIHVLISSCTGAAISDSHQFQNPQLRIHSVPDHASHVVFAHVRIVNWDSLDVIISFNSDVALSEVAVLACEAFNHCPGAFDIVCAHSRTVYSPSQFGISLSQVGLVPNGKVHLHKRQAAPLAEIEIFDLVGKSTVVHFEVTATLNDIACFVRDHRHKRFPQKSFSVVVNGNAVFQESSFASTNLLKAGLLPGGKVSFHDMQDCCIGAGCETSIKDFLRFATAVIVVDSPLFHSDTAALLVSLLRCSLCYHAQADIMNLLMLLLPTCNESIIAGIRHILFQRIDELSSVNIRCQCRNVVGLDWYDEFFHRFKDSIGHTLLEFLLALRALPNAIDDADFFEMVDRIVVSRTHLYRHTLWLNRRDNWNDLTTALAELLSDQLRDLIVLIGQTSPQSPQFLRTLSKIMIIILKDPKNVLSRDLIRVYVSAIQNARDTLSQFCSDAALIAAFIFSLHLEKETSKCKLSIKASNWNFLKAHFHIVADIFLSQGDAVLPPMISVCSSFIEASCQWFGPGNLKSKRNFNTEFGEARLSSLVSAAVAISSRSNYLFLDASAVFFKTMASNAQLSHHLTVVVPDAIIHILENYNKWNVKWAAPSWAHEDKSEWLHACEAFHDVVNLPHLEAAVLTPRNLEILSQYYSHSKVMDIFDKMQSIPIGRDVVGASLHTIVAVLKALNKGSDEVQSKAIKVLAAGLEAPASIVWRQAPGLKETLNHLVQLARNFYCVDGKKRVAEQASSYNHSHILFSSDYGYQVDLNCLLKTLICCSSRLLMISGTHIEMNLDPVFDIRDLLIFTFDLFNNLDDQCVSQDSHVMSSFMRVLAATPSSLICEHILNYFDDNSGSVPIRVLCALNTLANDASVIQVLLTNEMMTCLLKVGRNPIVSSCLELVHTQQANEKSLHLESLKPEYDLEHPPPKKRKYSLRSSYEEYKIECHKFEALKQQRLNGLAHSRSLYQLIAKLAKNDKDGIFATEDMLRMLMEAVRPRTNICVIPDILAAIYHIFCKRSRVDTHASFSVATFSKLRRFSFTVLGQMQTVSQSIAASDYSKDVIEDLWGDICVAVGVYVHLLGGLYPFRSFRRALTKFDSTHLGGSSIITVVVQMLASATKLSSSALVKVRPFDLLDRMLLSPVKRDFVADLFPKILQFVVDDQAHQQKYFQEKHEQFEFTWDCWFEKYDSDVLSSVIAFMSNFAHRCPHKTLQHASQMSSFALFACRMASYVSPRIVQATCSFVEQLLHTSFSGAVYASFASSSFEDLSALCDFAMPHSTEPSDFLEVALAYGDKLSVVQLILKVASLGPLSGDRITLALLRLIWGCCVSNDPDEMRHVVPDAQALLIGMGVTMHNFFHVLPKHSQPIAADAECYLGDMCCADADDALEYKLVCGHVGHAYCMFQPVFTSGKCCISPACRHVCVFKLRERDSSESESSEES